MKNKIIMFFAYSLFFSVNGYCQFNTVLQKKDIPKAEPVLATTENKLIEEKDEGGNLAASKIRNLECPNYEICLIDYGCGKFNRKIHIMEQYP